MRRGRLPTLLTPPNVRWGVVAREDEWLAPRPRWPHVLLAAALVVALGCMTMPQGVVGRGSMPIEVATGEAFVGPWRMNESDFRYVDDPTVAMNQHGDVGVAWANQAEQDIFFQRYRFTDTPRLDEPTNISRSGDTFSWLPRIVMTDDEPATVYALWQEIVFSGGSHGGEILFARSTDGGASFSEPINLSNTIAGAGKGRLTQRRWDNGSLDLAMDEAGKLYAAWTEYEGALRFSRSTDGGASFSEPMHIAGDNVSPARAPSLALADEGRVYLAWTVGEDDAADVHLARSDDAGETFDEPRTVIESDGHIDAPRLAVDQRGVLHLVHAESPDGRFGHYHIHYTRSTNGAELFEPSRRIANPDHDWIHGAGFPEVALIGDGDTRVLLLWSLYPDIAQRSRGVAFAHSNDAGESFGQAHIWRDTADPDLGITGSLQGGLMRRLATHDRGHIAVVTSHFKPNEMSRIRLYLAR